MAQFFDNVITWFNSLGDLFDIIINILYAPFQALILLFEWFFSLFDFFNLFDDTAYWAFMTLPQPLSDIAFFLLTFLALSLFIGVLKIFAR